MEYYKQHLPNYGVFDEKRYFIPGPSSKVIHFKGVVFSVLICEDAWVTDVSVKAESDVVLLMNASPFRREKPLLRRKQVKKILEVVKKPVLYVNHVGGQDELVFDGGSFAMSAQGDVVAQSPFFAAALSPVFVTKRPTDVQLSANHPVIDLPSELSLLYEALIMGLRDYVKQNGFSTVYLGLSGGIDSALTLALAVAALGAQQVVAVAMPSVYTAKESLDYAKRQANALKVALKEISIMPLMTGFSNALFATDQRERTNVTEQNIQARIRGVLLMALANENHGLVLATGNKSELAMGYCTLYGDMVGGFAVLKDVFKQSVYELAAYCNQLAQEEVIPQAVIHRAPTAELAPNQKDTDSLPPYAQLDRFLALYIEERFSLEQLRHQGFSESFIKKTIHQINKNEYKRRQAPPGVRVSKKGFGRNRRYPITSQYILY